jgi:hypothetical protein
LAPGAGIPVSTPAHVLFALTDLELSQTSGTSAQSLHLDPQGIRILPGGTSFRMINSGKNSAKFILVEF